MWQRTLLIQRQRMFQMRIQLLLQMRTQTNTSAESEIALSGQLYGVHVTAQDLHTDATADSTIKLDLKDMGSGLPVSGLFVSMGKTEEEALSSEVM